MQPLMGSLRPNPKRRGAAEQQGRAMTVFRLALSVLFVAVASIASVRAASPPTGSLALVGGTVYVDPYTTPIENGTVLIKDGVIVAVGRRQAVKIPKNVTTIDCAGMSVAAGFWNSDVHFHERTWFDADKVAAEDLAEHLRQMLTRRGFTSVFDTWSNHANTQRLRARIESGEIVAARDDHWIRPRAASGGRR
jgi:hypothetical protein